MYNSNGCVGQYYILKTLQIRFNNGESVKCVGEKLLKKTSSNSPILKVKLLFREKKKAFDEINI